MHSTQHLVCVPGLAKDARKGGRRRPQTRRRRKSRSEKKRRQWRDRDVLDVRVRTAEDKYIEPGLMKDAGWLRAIEIHD